MKKASVLFLVLACIVGLVGCGQGKKRLQDGPLTEDELSYFNEQFFNGDSFNIHNQFLSSTYGTPEEINIFELVYCGVPQEYDRDSGKPRADEDAVLELVYGGDAPDCPQYELNTATLDAFLTDTLGLSLAETKQVGMENFTYLPEYDTYYWSHGDTNYRAQVEFTDGVRDGDLLYLYYEDDFYADGQKWLTLREVKDGGYQFVANRYQDTPAA